MIRRRASAQSRCLFFVGPQWTPQRLHNGMVLLLLASAYLIKGGSVLDELQD